MAANAAPSMDMDTSIALATFVPLWIFKLLLLIGIVTWISTPNPNRKQKGRLSPGPNETGFGAGNAHLTNC